MSTPDFALLPAPRLYSPDLDRLAPEANIANLVIWNVPAYSQPHETLSLGQALILAHALAGPYAAIVCAALGIEE